MSYMNDETDPFGVPYSKKNTEETLEEIEYSLKDYTELLNREKDFKRALSNLDVDIHTAKEQIEKTIDRTTDGVIWNIHFNKDSIIVRIDSVSLSRLVELKEVLSLKDIEIRQYTDSPSFKLILLW